MRVPLPQARLPAGGRAARGGAWYFAAITLVNVGNFVFHVVYSRALGPGPYSGLGALLAVIVIVSVPLGAVQLACAQAQAQAQARAQGSMGARRLILLASGGGAGVCIVTCASAAPLKVFFRLGTSIPLLLLGGYLALATASAAAQGILVGEERFAELAWTTAAGSGGGRLVLGLALAETRPGVSGALLATLLGQMITFASLLVVLRARLRPTGPQLRLSLLEGAFSGLALTGLALLSTVDTLLARRLLSGPAAGYYVAAATVGRISLFASGGVALIVFPRFTSTLNSGRLGSRQLLWPLALIGGLGLVAAAIVTVAPRPIITTLYGASYLGATDALVKLSVAGAFLGCLTLLTYFHVATRSRLAFLPWPAAALVAGMAVASGHSVSALAWIILCVSALVTIVATLAAFASRRPARVAASVGTCATTVAVAAAEVQASLLLPSGESRQDS